MTSALRSEAQQRADDIGIFEAELERLESEGVLVLSEEQRRAVSRQHQDLLATFARTHDIDLDMRARQLSRGMQVASFLGALALAASVFFLLQQIWGSFSTAGQVTVLIGGSVATFVFTIVLRMGSVSAYFTKLAAMVAFGCFVIDLAMLGWMFNITPSDWALVAWAALAFLFAYTCDQRLLLAAGILSMMAFVAMRTGTFAGLYWLDFGERPENFFPAAAIMFIVPQLIPHERYAGFGALYRTFALLAVFLPVLVLGDFAGELSYLEMDPGTIKGTYQVMGFVLSAAAVWLGMRRQWSEVANLGTVFFVIFLYTKFFDWWWETMPKYLFFLVLGLIALVLIAVLRKLRAKGYALIGSGTP
jgi:uncharacterized membrane protein